MKTAVYAGSFDPITNGHMDIIKSASEIFDRVIVAVAFNTNKNSFLSRETRMALIQECVQNMHNVEVDSFEGLTVEYAKRHGSNILIRGLRNSADFEYEAQLSQTNSMLSKEIKTIFLVTKPEYSFISSSAVREILANDGDISNLVPEPIKKYFETRHDI